MVTGLEDFFIRRTGIMYFNPSKMMEILPQTQQIFKDLFGWTDQDATNQSLSLMREFEKATRF